MSKKHNVKKPEDQEYKQLISGIDIGAGKSETVVSEIAVKDDESYYVVAVTATPTVVKVNSLDDVKQHIVKAVRNRPYVASGENRHVLVFKGKQLRLSNCVSVVYVEEDGQVAPVFDEESAQLRTDGLI